MRRDPILPRRVLIRSGLSGAAWAGIAVPLLWLVSGEPVTTLAWKFRGGIAAAPFIGTAAGLSWRVFLRARLGGRLALVTLYGAVFLFFAAAGLTNLAAGVPGSVSVSNVLRESVVGVILGLTWTGFVLVLLPAAFVNHTWIARAGAAARIA